MADAGVDVWEFSAQLQQLDTALDPFGDANVRVSGRLAVELSVMHSDGAGEWPELSEGTLREGLQLIEAQVDKDLQRWAELTARSQQSQLGYARIESTNAVAADLLHLLVAVDGGIGGAASRAGWLEIWLYAEAGRLLGTGPITLPPAGLRWQEGWARITCYDASGAAVAMEGPLEEFRPWQPDLPAPERDWEAFAVELANRLEDRTARVIELEAALARSELRAQKLRSAVHTLADEQQQLADENERLKQRMEEQDGELLDRLDRMVASAALLQTKLEEVEAERMLLRTELNDRNLEVVRLRRDSEQSGRKVALLESTAAGTAKQLEVSHPSAGVIGYVTIAEQPPRVDGLLLSEEAGELLRRSRAEGADSQPRTHARPGKFRR